MDIEQLNALSYKELQAHAKQLNIAANQKKEILVQEIIAIGSGANDENSAVAANKVVIKVPASVTKAPVTPQINRSVRVTRSTAKKALAVEEISEVAVPTATVNVDDVKNDSMIEAISPHVKTPVDAKPVLPLSAGKNTVCFAEELEMGPCESYNEEDNEEDEEYPNPTTLFEAEDELEQNLSALEISTTPKAPVNKHVYFTSPELRMGNAVHWNYDDYSKEEKQGQEEQAVNDEDGEDTRSEASAESEAEEASQQSRMKLPAGHGDRVMNFWLTKAFAMPSLNYFK